MIYNSTRLIVFLLLFAALSGCQPAPDHHKNFIEACNGGVTRSLINGRPALHCSDSITAVPEVAE